MLSFGSLRLRESKDNVLENICDLRALNVGISLNKTEKKNIKSDQTWIVFLTNHKNVNLTPSTELMKMELLDYKKPKRIQRIHCFAHIYE